MNLTYFGILIKYVDGIEQGRLSRIDGYNSPKPHEIAIVAFNGKAYLIKLWQLKSLLEMAWKGFETLKDAPVEYTSFGNALVTKFVEGVVGTIEDVYLGGKRTLGVLRTRKFDEVGNDNLRLYELVTDNFGNVMVFFASIVTGEVIVQILKKHGNITKEQRKSLQRILLDFTAKRIGKMVARKLIKAITVKILRFLVADAVIKKIIGVSIMSKAVGRAGPGIIFSLLSFQALLEKASIGSKGLQKENPLLYKILKSYDLDLLWFLVKPHMEEMMFITSMDLGLKNQNH